MDEWLGQHRAFLKRETAFRPAEVRRRALVAIDAGGVDGAPLGDVHRAIKSAHLPAWLINLIVDRLVADGHVYRERIETGGRPRIQMWSFRHAPEGVRLEMAGRGLGVDDDFTRPRWDGMSQENIIVDVLRWIRGEKLRARDLVMAAGHVYVDANGKMAVELFKGRDGAELTKGEMHKLLLSMASRRRIWRDMEDDAFYL